MILHKCLGHPHPAAEHAAGAGYRGCGGAGHGLVPLQGGLPPGHALRWLPRQQEVAACWGMLLILLSSCTSDHSKPSNINARNYWPWPCNYFALFTGTALIFLFNYLMWILCIILISLKFQTMSLHLLKLQQVTRHFISILICPQSEKDSDLGWTHQKRG